MDKAWNPLTALEVLGDLNTNKQAHAYGASTFTYPPVFF